MPTLDWIGKDKVINHHFDVPYRVLDEKYSYGDENDNMIIHGDNLSALKSLLPKYEGRIRCIYIDPPYNTGNEGWRYNDNVNDPRIKKWLGEVVGSEGEDLSRHDKWLCMMYPRLKLLHKLLAKDGVIFISIDDNELYNLKMICDEIFGSNCFVANISWQRTYSIRNDSKGIPLEVEHILVYSKLQSWQPNKLPRTEKMDASYKNPDGDRCSWMSGSPIASDAKTHQGMVYAIQHPFTGKMLYPNVTAHWRYSQEQMLEYMNGWCPYELKDLNDAEKRAEICGVSKDEVRADVKAIVLSKPYEESKIIAQKVYDIGPWPRFYFTNGGKGGIRRKVYADSVDGRISTNYWTYDEVGHTDEAKKELKTVFNGSIPFDTPKPVRLIERILAIAGDNNSIILDSFAGSGTTAHAVLNMNKQDGGNRKFILIEMMDYADSITAERVKRVIDGYGEGKKATPGTGGGFAFYELGETLLNGEYLNENVPLEKIREYVYFTETKQAVTDKADEPYFLGENFGTAYYFYYDKNEVTTLDRDFLHTVKTKADSYVIYADKCILSDEELEKLHITFKKIPRDITRM
ncbi:MAG: site-specific DNA-methyltransferase [Oscillospiraceae bacterium]